jgi:anti-anti-sigma factor
MPRLKFEEIDGVTVILMQESALYDDANVLQKRREIDALVEQHDIRKIVLDFAQVTLMGSAALGMLIRLQAKYVPQGRRMALCRVQPTVREVFRITRLERIIEIFDTLDEAVEALNREAAS